MMTSHYVLHGNLNDTQLEKQKFKKKKVMQSIFYSGTAFLKKSSGEEKQVSETQN